MLLHRSSDLYRSSVKISLVPYCRSSAVTGLPLITALSKRVRCPFSAGRPLPLVSGCPLRSRTSGSHRMSGTFLARLYILGRAIRSSLKPNFYPLLLSPPPHSLLAAFTGWAPRRRDPVSALPAFVAPLTWCGDRGSTGHSDPVNTTALLSTRPASGETSSPSHLLLDLPR